MCPQRDSSFHFPANAQGPFWSVIGTYLDATLVCWLVFHVPHWWGVCVTSQIPEQAGDIQRVTDLMPLGVEATSSPAVPYSAFSLVKISALKTELSAAWEGPGEDDPCRISLQGLAVKSPVNSRSGLSAIHLAGPKHLSCLYWMRQIAFRDRCISTKLATKWISIKRIPFSPGFHYKIGKFVTLGGKPSQETKMNFGGEKN